MEELKNCKDTVSLIRAYALYRPLLRKEDILSLRCFSDTTISLPIARVILGDYFYFAIKILRLFGWEESRPMGGILGKAEVAAEKSGAERGEECKAE